MLFLSSCARDGAVALTFGGLRAALATGMAGGALPSEDLALVRVRRGWSGGPFGGGAVLGCCGGAAFAAAAARAFAVSSSSSAQGVRPIPLATQSARTASQSLEPKWLRIGMSNQTDLDVQPS